jgi:hypothetical protein
VIFKKDWHPSAGPYNLVKGNFAGSRLITDTRWHNHPVKEKKLAKALHFTVFFSKLQIISRILKSNYLSAFLKGCMLSST